MNPAFQVYVWETPSSSTSSKTSWPFAPCLTSSQARHWVALTVSLTGTTGFGLCFLAFFLVVVVLVGVGRFGFALRAGFVLTGAVSVLTCGGGVAFSPPNFQATKNSTATATMPARATITPLFVWRRRGTGRSRRRKSWSS